MITRAQYQHLQQGCFVSLKLHNGPNLSGFAVQDPEEPKFARIDGLVVNDEDGLFAQFSLRIEQKDIQMVDFLSTTPTFTDRFGNEVTMDASLWPDMD